MNALGSAAVANVYDSLIPVWCVVASARVTVLMMWRSWNRDTPSGVLRSEAG